MLCDHCGDCYGLLIDVRVLNQFTNLLGGKWTVWVCAGYGHVEFFLRERINYYNRSIREWAKEDLNLRPHAYQAWHPKPKPEHCERIWGL